MHYALTAKGFSQTFTSWSRPLKRTCYLVLECNLSWRSSSSAKWTLICSASSASVCCLTCWLKSLRMLWKFITIKKASDLRTTHSLLLNICFGQWVTKKDSEIFCQGTSLIQYWNTLTHNTSKDVSKDESPNTDPQDDVDLYSDRINHLDEISKDIIPVIQSKELKQGNKSISKSAAI